MEAKIFSGERWRHHGVRPIPKSSQVMGAFHMVRLGHRQPESSLGCQAHRQILCLWRRCNDANIVPVEQSRSRAFLWSCERLTVHVIETIDEVPHAKPQSPPVQNRGHHHILICSFPTFLKSAARPKAFPLNRTRTKHWSQRSHPGSSPSLRQAGATMTAQTRPS